MSDTVEVIIRAKDEVTKTVGGIRGALGGLGNAVGTAAEVGKAAFLGVGAAAVGGFGIAMRESINMNASLEQSTMMFTTLMGDADLATEHVASLFQFAADTPFETAEIIAASKHFQVFGGEALNTLDNLTLVGDAAAAVGAPFDEVAFWVGRAYSAIEGGQPFGEAAMRLQELGLMTPEVRTEMENLQKSGADASEVWGAFEGQMGSFTGAMELQSQSWNGISSTIRDNLSMAAAQGLKPFFDIALQGLSGLATWLSSPEVQAGIQTFATGLQTALEKFGTFVTETIVPFVQEHGPQLKAVFIALGIAIMATMIPAAISLVTALAPILLVVAAIAAAAWVLSTAWEENWGDIQGKTAAAWAAIQPIIQAIKDWITNTLIPALQQLWDQWVNVVWPAIQTAMANAWEIIQPILQAIGDFIANTLIPKIQELYAKWVDEVWPAIQTALTNAWTVIEEVFTEVGRWINDNIVPWVEFLRQKWVDEVWPAIQGALETAWAIIEPIWESFKEWLSVTLPPIIEGLRTIFETAMGGIKNAIQPVKDTWDALVDAVKGFWNWITGKNFKIDIQLPDLPDWARPGSPIPLHTRWKDFADDMPGIGSKIGAGFLAAFASIKDAGAGIEFLFDKINSLGGLASGFEGVFKRQVLDPMEGQLEAVQGQLGTTGGLIQELLTGLGLSDDLNNPWLLNQLQGIVSGGGGSFEDVTEAAVVLGLLEDRRDLLLQEQALQENLLSQQQRLMLMEQQRADLNFLQQQLDLLKLIDDNGLDISILEGIKLGVDADPSGLMQAMSEAMQMMLTQASSNLAGQTTPTDRMGGRSLANEFFGKTGDAGTTVVNIDARGAERGAAGDIRRVVEQVLREQGTRADIRMRTT